MVGMATKVKNIEYLKIFLPKTLRLRVTKFGMCLHLMDLYKIPVPQIIALGAKLTLPWGVHKFYKSL